MRVNLGSGLGYMEGWVNVDASPDVKTDVRLDAFEFVERFGPEVDELYMGHFLEHLLREQAESLLRTMIDRLPVGTVVSAVTPDMNAVFRAYLAGEVDNRLLNELYVYNYLDPCHHVWCHDVNSLIDLFHTAGFEDVEAIDPLTWPPVYHKTGPDSRWQCGVRGIVPAVTKGVTRSPKPEPVAQPGPPSMEAHVAPSPELLRNLLRTREHLLRELARYDADLDDSREALQATREELHRLSGMPGSRAYRAAVSARRAVGVALPRGTRRREVTERLARRALGRAPLVPSRIVPGAEAPLDVDEDYSRWAEEHQANAEQLRQQRRLSTRLGQVVRFLIVIRADGADPVRLDETLASISQQSWGHWRSVVVADDPSSLAGREKVSAVRLDSSGYHATVNALVESADDRDFLVMLEAGDLLSPDALCEVALAARRDPQIDVVYWDDDLVVADGVLRDPRFRPSWSPDLLLSYDYVGRSFAMRRARFRFAGGLRGHLGDAALWDLLLLTELDGRVARVPRVLGHLVSRPDAVDGNGVAAVNDHLTRRGVPAHAVRVDDRCELRWDDDAPAPMVSVIVPTRHNRQMLARLLPSLRRTEYASWELVLIDNGERTRDNEAWYASMLEGIDATVHWWDKPFNYSAVNNEAARRARGEVLIFLNDDTEIVDPLWMREMVGWAMRPGIGAVGMTLLEETGRVQHAGVVLGLNGFADHVFEGMRPEERSIFGPVLAYRNCLSVTAACMAIQRSRFDEVGGFDEHFLLCGSDVVLGLDLHRRGYRNVCSSSTGVRHFESLTRGTHVPYEDFFASYWRYQSWIFGGDPYYSPNLSLESRRPVVRQGDERTPGQRISEPLGRSFEVFRQGSDANEAWGLANNCRATAEDREAVEALHRANASPFALTTINWYIPDLDSPYYGGINTALRLADHLTRHHGVRNRFVAWGRGPEPFLRSALAATFPHIADSEIIMQDGSARALDAVPPADVAIATLWVTAYHVALTAKARRKFYLIQDYEPAFYPAGSTYALAEESYRLGLYGICNTPNLLRVYGDEYGGRGMAFTPAVDRSVFHAEGRRDHTGDEPVTLFVYSRPGHWRNCWEVASLALREAKQRLGDRLRIVTAGSWAVSRDLEERAAMTHLGLLDYAATGELYRQCDIGMALTVSRHPSYLPLELMACGVPVIAFDNPWGHWLLQHNENSWLAERTVDGLVEAIVRMVRDQVLRRKLADNALKRIDMLHSDWDAALSPVFTYLCDPEGWSGD